MAIGDPPLTDVPGRLRLLADALRVECAKCGCVVIVDHEDGRFDVSAFGDVDSIRAASMIATAGVQLGNSRLAQRP